MQTALHMVARHRACKRKSFIRWDRNQDLKCYLPRRASYHNQVRLLQCLIMYKLGNIPIRSITMQLFTQIAHITVISLANNLSFVVTERANENTPTIFIYFIIFKLWVSSYFQGYLFKNFSTSRCSARLRQPIRHEKNKRNIVEHRRKLSVPLP